MLLDISVVVRPVVCLVLGTSFWCASGQALAQDRIFRCGNEYTNNPTPAQKKSCIPLDGGNVTVVKGTRVQGAASAPVGGGRVASATPVASSADQTRVDPTQQKVRDNDARTILENELKRAELRVAELQREYSGGQPERQAAEQRNPALYTQRVADLKASLNRAEADVTGIRRELQRVGGGVAPALASSTTAQR